MGEARETALVSSTYAPFTWSLLTFKGGKTIPDSAEPRLESFCPQFVAAIDLPHQGVVDSYSLVHPGVRDKRRVFEIDLSQPKHETTFWWRHNGAVTS